MQPSANRPPAPPPTVRGRGNGTAPVAVNAPKAPSRITLAGVTRGKIVQPRRILAYGHEAAGKSSFAAGADNPVFLCAEDGTANLDVVRLPEPQTWDEVFDCLDLLRVPEFADRKTLVVDTIDWLEPLAERHVCKKASKESIEDFGYGRGRVACVDEWRKFIAALERLKREKGMWIVLLAHSIVKNFANPEGDNYDRYQLKLNEKIGGLVKEWCDEILFMRVETLTYKETEKSKAKGVSNGERVMHTVRTAAYDAKCRCALPEQITYTDIGWKAYADALAAATTTNETNTKEGA